MECFVDSVRLFANNKKLCSTIWKTSSCFGRLCDANWISDSGESRSTSGYVFTLGGATVLWKFSKQILIVLSMMESEFVASDKVAEEAEWFRQNKLCSVMA